MDNTFVICAAVAALIIIKGAHQEGVLDELGLTDPEDQTGGLLDQVPDFEDLTNYAQDAFAEEDVDQTQRNLAAILWAIRKAEGTAWEEGYQALFGWRPGNGKIFTNFAAHPRQFFTYTDLAGKTIRTSAAGAYQITATTYDALMKG